MRIEQESPLAKMIHVSMLLNQKKANFVDSLEANARS